MKRRWLKTSIILILVFFVEICACNIPILKNLYWKGFISETVLNESMIMGDYHSVSEYGFVGMIVFIVYMFWVVRSDNEQKIIRYRYRKKYTGYILKEGLQGTVIFSLLHELTSIFFLIALGNVKLLIEHGWLHGIVFQIIINILFYMQLFVISRIIMLKISEENTQIIIIASYTIMHVIYQETYYKTSIWMPQRELTMLQNICGSHYTWIQSVVGIIKFFLILIILVAIFTKKQQKKEWYGNEKE